jgi:SAM-dependent methyltransferase
MKLSDLSDEARLYSLARIYDSQHEGFDEDLPFWRSFARESGGPLLELACGSGRIAIELAANGHEVSGVDFSESMIELAREEARARSLSADFRIGDMRSFSLARRFRAIFVGFNSFSHLLTPEDALACLSRVREHLDDEGRLALSVFVPDFRLLDLSGSGTYPVAEFPDPEGGRVELVETRRYRLDTQINEITWFFQRENETLRQRFRLKMWYPVELRYLLQSAGFEIERRFGDFEGSPFDERAYVQVIIARLSPQ